MQILDPGKQKSKGHNPDNQPWETGTESQGVTT